MKLDTNILFWNVDTQKDFIQTDGALSVTDAQNIVPNLARLTQLAADYNLQVVNTADWHYAHSAELSTNPDFVHTYPPHCLADTDGAAYIAQTQPLNPAIIHWDDKGVDPVALSNRNIVLYKDAFDVFSGNPHTDSVLAQLPQSRVVVYGVATNVCVEKAVRGLVQRGKDVYVVSDAIKHLPHLDEMDHPLYKGLEGTLLGWRELGVKELKTDGLATELGLYK